VLYHYGGVYTDDDVYLLSTPSLQTLTVVQESPVFKDNLAQVGLFNAYIEVPRPYDPTILKAIKMSIREIYRANRKSQNRELALWGPIILKNAVQGADHIELMERCSVTPCDCRVPGVLISHKPCRY